MSQMTPTTAHVAATRTAGTYQGSAAARGAGAPGAEAAALVGGMAGLDDPTPDPSLQPLGGVAEDRPQRERDGYAETALDGDDPRPIGGGGAGPGQRPG